MCGWRHVWTSWPLVLVWKGRNNNWESRDSESNEAGWLRQMYFNTPAPKF